jgi:DNA-binding NtrC family response regulator
MKEKSLNILIVDDEKIVHQTLAPYLRDCGHSVESAEDGANGLSMLEKNDYNLALLDVRMPGVDGISVLSKIQEQKPELSVVIITGHGNMDLAIQALRAGAADFLTKPIKLPELDAVLEKASRLHDLRKKERRLKETIGEIQILEDYRERGRGLIAESPAMKEVKKRIKMAVEAKCDTILLTGETGTGKEVAAREIHLLGMAPEFAPFIAISCPALPETLIESELFGHVRGTFTGANADKAGCFELADGGTLFLDEVADLSPAAQAKLLRVLETRSVRRVGGSKEVPVNVRVIAATNHPLTELVNSGKFRQDLFYRLNIFTIDLRPLKERKEDLIPLAEHFLSAFSASSGIKVDGLSKPAKQLLLNYSFPGNARELRNIVQCAAIIARSGMIEPEHISLPAEKSEPAPGKPEKLENKDDDEKSRIIAALEKTKWNRQDAARQLGIPYSTLRHKIKKFGIS